MVIGSLTETYYDSFLLESLKNDYTYTPDKYDINRIDKEMQNLKHISEIAEDKPMKWIDNMLLKLKNWTRKIENTPKPENGIIAKAFYNMKTLLAKVIKRLTQLALRGAGTYKRWARKYGHQQLQQMRKDEVSKQKQALQDLTDAQKPQNN